MLFAHLVPCTPEFKKKNTLSFTDFVQDYVICFVQPNVAKLYRVRITTNKKYSVDVQILGLRQVVLKEELDEDTQIDLVPKFNDKNLIVGV